MLLELPKLFDPVPATVLLFYSEYQPIYGEMLQNKLIDEAIQGVPQYPELRDILLEHKPKGHVLALFDDSKDSFPSLESLYAIGSHHLNTSVIVLTQTLFGEGQSLRNISANATYFVLMKTVRQQNSIRTLGQQM